MAVTHYSAKAAAIKAAASTYSVHAVTCGAELNGYKLLVGQHLVSDNEAAVTCKRCQKSLETGMATTGLLAFTAEAKAERAARAAQ